MATGAELTYTSTTALNMANAIFGAGVTVTGASYTGPASSAAVYSNGQLAPGVVPSNTGVILSTGRAADFTQSSGDPNRNTGTSTDTTGINNNSLFNTIAGATTFDAVWLDVDFIPTGDEMTIRFVFSSEEYPEYINSQYNDVVGVWVNGTHVPIEVGNGRTSVNNINGNTQENLFRSNTNDAYNTEMDGFTITMTLKMAVNPGVVNSIRIGIADTSDARWDSNLLIAGDSVQTVLVANNDAVNINPFGTKTVSVLDNDSGPPGSVLTITHINGVAVVAGQTVTLASGQQITLNANGTFTVLGDGNIESKTFTYSVTDQFGNTDTAFVTMTSVPCFVAGTLIQTLQGERPVETLQIGDLVMTHDDGPQPVRWIGQRRVAAVGALAPIRIKANTFGDHRTLLLSPQHRVLIRDGLAELLFGEPEVLVAAKDLVNDRSIRVQEGGEVDYVHILFDRHQVVFSEGLATESFLPGPQVTAQLERDIVDEIAAIFPELNPRTGDGYGPSARRTLRGHEAQVLLAAARVA
ncbi:MAG: Hint domain-containing protein [Rhodobacteraceae bacterium]|jgi:Hint domain|nr:Hint domain-containing protein [Paracoccaceae bacterium]